MHITYTVPIAFWYAELVSRTDQSSVEKFCRYKFGRWRRRKRGRISKKLNTTNREAHLIALGEEFVFEEADLWLLETRSKDHDVALDLNTEHTIRQRPRSRSHPKRTSLSSFPSPGLSSLPRTFTRTPSPVSL